MSPETQDSFTFPPADTPRRQTAVRDAAAVPGTWPLIVFSHGSASWRRRMSTYLCTHLSSHGYVVAALDHSETFAAELARREGETDEQGKARAEALIGSRVPDIRFLLDHLLHTQASLDPVQICVVGYSC